MHQISTCAPIFGTPFLLPAVLVGDLAPGLRAASRAALGEARGLLGFLGLDPAPLLPARARPLATRSAVPLAPVRLHLATDRRALARARLKALLAPAFQPVVDTICQDGTVLWQAKFAHRTRGLPYQRQVLQVKLLDAVFHQFHIHEPQRLGERLAALLSPAVRCALRDACQTAEEAAALLCAGLADLPPPAGSDAEAHGALSTDVPALWRALGGAAYRIAGLEGEIDPVIRSRVAQAHASLCAALTPLFDKR